MTTSIERDKELFRCRVQEVVKEALLYLKGVPSDHFCGYFLPDVTLANDDFPKITSSYDLQSTAIPDYKTALVDSIIKNFESYKKLALLIKSSDYLTQRLRCLPSNSPEISNWYDLILDTESQRIVREIVDRYVQCHKGFEFSEKRFDEIYKPYCRGIFQEKLKFDICVPILFLMFDFDEQEIGPQTSIKRMSREFYVARYLQNEFNLYPRDDLLHRCTHMFMVEEVNIEDFLFRRFPELGLSNEEKSKIDNFFAAIRLATGLNTGYSQIILNPKGWVFNYKADLPSIISLKRTAFSITLDEIQPQIHPNASAKRILSLETTQKIGRYFSKLTLKNEKKLEVAASRLNRCYLDFETNDLILNAAIGCESLLGDGNSEITYKLAMRAGALAKFSDDFKDSPKVICENIKQIYKARSDIVHGNVIKKDPEGIARQAVDYFRKIFAVLLDNPEYLNPKKIDEELLLGPLAKEA